MSATNLPLLAEANESQCASLALNTQSDPRPLGPYPAQFPEPSPHSQPQLLLTWSISNSCALAPGHSMATLTMSDGGGIVPYSTASLGHTPGHHCLGTESDKRKESASEPSLFHFGESDVRQDPKHHLELFGLNFSRSYHNLSGYFFVSLH